MPTGIDTSTAFLQPPSTRTRFASMSKAVATRWSWSRAMSYGFARRCEVGASTVVTGVERDCRGEYTQGSLEGERQPAHAQRAPFDGVRDHPHDVAAGGQKLPVGPTAGDAERVAPWEHVAQPGQE